jgi:putative ABC transport system substrate-binding protein
MGLRDLGYVEDKNITFAFRSAETANRLPEVAADLVRLKVDVIFATSSTEVEAARQATKTIPIVFATHADPVGSGLVSSLARPGGNITAVTFLGVGLFAKQMELLKQVVPGLTRVAFLWDPTMPTTAEDLREVRAAAQALGLRLQVAGARGAADYDSAFAAMVVERAGAVVIAGSPTFIQDRSRIVSFAAKRGLPAAYGFKESAEAGGLVSYGPRQADSARLAASYVDKILNGAKPADLPVEQPTKFEVVINLKTAKALGLGAVGAWPLFGEGSLPDRALAKDVSMLV